MTALLVLWLSTLFLAYSIGKFREGSWWAAHLKERRRDWMRAIRWYRRHPRFPRDEADWWKS